MKTTYYWGDYTKYGHPTLIVTEFEQTDMFIVQCFLFFENRKPILFKEFYHSGIMKSNDPEKFSITKEYLNNTVLSIIVPGHIQGFINVLYGENDDTLNLFNSVRFRETTPNLVGYLKDKFPNELKIVGEKTKDNDVKGWIEFYNNVTINEIQSDEINF